MCICAFLLYFEGAKRGFQQVLGEMGSGVSGLAEPGWLGRRCGPAHPSQRLPAHCLLGRQDQSNAWQHGLYTSRSFDLWRKTRSSWAVELLRWKGDDRAGKKRVSREKKCLLKAGVWLWWMAWAAGAPCTCVGSQVLFLRTWGASVSHPALSGVLTC